MCCFGYGDFLMTDSTNDNSKQKKKKAFSYTVVVMNLNQSSLDCAHGLRLPINLLHILFGKLRFRFDLPSSQQKILDNVEEAMGLIWDSTPPATSLSQHLLDVNRSISRLVIGGLPFWVWVDNLFKIDPELSRSSLEVAVGMDR